MGLGPLVGKLVRDATKNAVKFDAAIDPIIAKLKESCPGKAELDKILAQKNQFTQALTQLQTSLNTLSSTGSTIDGVATATDISISVIKAIPLPTSVPPGVGLPLNVVTGFSSTLDALSVIVKEAKGVSSQVAPSIDIINKQISKVIEKLSLLDGLLAGCLEDQTAGMSDGEKEAYFESLGINLSSQDDVNTPSATDINGNAVINESLEERLKPGSTNPLIYKGFTIIVDSDAGNKFSFPSRRAIGTNDDGVKVTTPFSYSSSTQVLVDTVKWEIDKLDSLEIQRLAEEASRQAREDALREEQKRILQREQIAYNIGKSDFSKNVPITENPIPRQSGPREINAWERGWRDAKTEKSNLLSQSVQNSTSPQIPTPTQSYTPFSGPGVNNQVKTKSGKYYKYTSQYKKWIQFTPSPLPFQVFGTSNGENKNITRYINNNGSQVRVVDTYNWDTNLYKWVFKSSKTYN